MRLRVVLDGRVIGPRFPGIGRYVLALAEALGRRRDVEPILLWRPSAAAGTDLAAIGVACRPVEVAPRSWAEQTRLPALAGSLGAAVWHAPYYVMPYRLPCPTVVTLHDLAPLALPDLWPRHRRAAIALLHRLALRRAAHALVVSTTARDELVRRLGADPARLTVTPLAAAPRFRPQPASETARVRRAYGLPARFVLTVATDTPTKNLGRLRAAMARLAAGAAPLDYACVVAGADSRATPADAPVRALGVVADADLPALYAAADLVVCPSLHEGFGLPVVEAMACGTAVACSRAASLPEVAGDAALFFDPTDVAAIAAAIRTAMGDAALRAGLAARGRARAGTFGWDEVARRTVEVYRAVA